MNILMILRLRRVRAIHILSFLKRLRTRELLEVLNIDSNETFFIYKLREQMNLKIVATQKQFQRV